MTLTLDDNQAAFQIKAFKPGHIQVNDTVYHRSLIITAQQLIEDWRPQTIDELNFEDLAVIQTLHPAIFILGTGPVLTFPPIEKYGELINLGIGVEIMNTYAACRTYNALTAENRVVAAALIIQ